MSAENPQLVSAPSIAVAAGDRIAHDLDQAARWCGRRSQRRAIRHRHAVQRGEDPKLASPRRQYLERVPLPATGSRRNMVAWRPAAVTTFGFRGAIDDDRVFDRRSILIDDEPGALEASHEAGARPCLAHCTLRTAVVSTTRRTPRSTLVGQLAGVCRTAARATTAAAQPPLAIVPPLAVIPPLPLSPRLQCPREAPGRRQFPSADSAPRVPSARCGRRFRRSRSRSPDACTRRFIEPGARCGSRSPEGAGKRRRRAW